MFTSDKDVMRIVINHITRMRQGYICVAGCEVGTLRHIRPVLSMGLISTDFLARNGGPFDMGAVIEFEATPQPSPPEVEDHVFDPRRLKRLEILSGPDFWTLLEEIAQPRLKDIFGKDLVPIGKNPGSCCVDVNRGCASLGCYRPYLRPVLYVGKSENRSRVRIMIDDGDFDLDLGVTDARLFRPDNATADEKKIEEVRARLRTPEKVLLSVGLSRAWPSSPDRPPVHWLQVNNLHFEGDPTWKA